MHTNKVLDELMTRSAEEVRRLLVGYACRHPQELRTAGAGSVITVGSTELVVPVFEQQDVPLVGRLIGFDAGEHSGVRLHEVEHDTVLDLLEAHGVGVRAAVTLNGEGFGGHVEIWEPTLSVPEALVRLRRFFDESWPQDEGEVTVAHPPADSDKDITMLTWGGFGQGSGELAVNGAEAAASFPLTTALDDARAAMLELFEGADLAEGPDGAVRFTADLTTATVTVDVADAADWRVTRV